jgi:hypothetical protein
VEEWPVHPESAPVTFDQANKEDVVQARSRLQLQLQLVGYHTDAFPDLEWIIKPWTIFTPAMNDERSHWSMKKTQPHPVPHRELQRAMVLFIVGLVLLLSLFQSIPNLGQELIARSQLMIDGHHAHRA